MLARAATINDRQCGCIGLVGKLAIAAIVSDRDRIPRNAVDIAEVKFLVPRIPTFEKHTVAGVQIRQDALRF